MIGVIVVPGHSAAMHGLDARRPAVLLPLCDRPMLQHVVESLIAQKVTEIELLVEHAPEAVEALLGNGDRWGGRFRYHLIAQPDRPYRSLKVLPQLKAESWVLVHADRYPCTTLPTAVQAPTMFYGPDTAELQGNPSSRWQGAAIFPAGFAVEPLATMSIDELDAYVATLVNGNGGNRIDVEAWLDATSPTALLSSQGKLLDRRLNGFTISGTEREPGIWVSRNVAIHPSAQLVAPLYIGPDTRINRSVRLGPNTVIQGECIVDSNTTIMQSLVAAGSYVGEGLELDHAIVDHNLLINVRLGTGVSVMESFLLGSLKRRRESFLLRLLRSLAALLLLAIFLPVLVLAMILYVLRGKMLNAVEAVRLPATEADLAQHRFGLVCIGQDAWSVARRAGWGAFTRQFLPGLAAVVRGDLGLVGLPPRSIREIDAMSPEWRDLYLGGVAGLITELSLVAGDPHDATQQYLADAYYSVRRSFGYNLRLAGRYFLRLLIPG